MVKRIATDLLSRIIRLKKEVDSELNDRFQSSEWDIKTYDGKTIKIQISSIDVRTPLKWENKVDYMKLHTSEDVSPSKYNYIKSLFTETWVTIPRFEVTDGSVDKLRPNQSINIRYLSALKRFRDFENADFRKVSPPVLIDDKWSPTDSRIETKIIYYGDISDYAEGIKESINNIRAIQQNMRVLVASQLLNLYSPLGNDAPPWENSEMARELVDFLYGKKISLIEAHQAYTRHLLDKNPDDLTIDSEVEIDGETIHPVGRLDTDNLEAEPVYHLQEVPDLP